MNLKSALHKLIKLSGLACVSSGIKKFTYLCSINVNRVRFVKDLDMSLIIEIEFLIVVGFLFSN